MKKRYIIIISVFIILFGSMFFYFHLIKKENLSSFYANTQYQVYDVEKEEIVSLLNLKEDKIIDLHVMKSLLLISSETILLFKVEEDYMETLKENISMYLSESYDDYDEEEQVMIKKRRIYEKDGYYVVVISKKADNIIERVKEYIDA